MPRASGGIDQWPFGGFSGFAYAAIGKGVCSHVALTKGNENT